MPAPALRLVRLPRADKAGARMQPPLSKPSSNSRQPRSSNKPHLAERAPHAWKDAGIPSNNPKLVCIGDTCAAFRADIDRLTIFFPFS